MVLLSGNSHPDLADLVSRHLDSRLGNSSVRNKVSWSWLTKVSQKITILWNNVKTNTICLISIFHIRYTTKQIAKQWLKLESQFEEKMFISFKLGPKTSMIVWWSFLSCVMPVKHLHVKMWLAWYPISLIVSKQKWRDEETYP